MLDGGVVALELRHQSRVGTALKLDASMNVGQHYRRIFAVVQPKRVWYLSRAPLESEYLR